MTQQNVAMETAVVEPPAAQFDMPQLPFLIDVDEFVRASQARQLFRVSGKGLCAAVLDTGLNTEHVDFAGRIAATRNFTHDYGGDANNATDGYGCGTQIGGIILANGDHVGMATEAHIAALKVLGNNGSGSFAWVEQALDWVLQNHAVHHIGVACVALSDGGNYVDDAPFAGSALAHRITALREARVAVVVNAGSHYFDHGSKQGMGFPAILRQTISVGAVYDAEAGSFNYRGAIAYSTRAGQITPFSQRLHQSVNRATRTEIFAPGAPVTSSGINGPHGESIQHGTSQATAVTAGIILLLQEFYLRHAGQMPTVDQVTCWLRRGGVPIVDGDDEDDNVEHTGLTFLRLDAVRALNACYRELVRLKLGPAL